MKKIELSESQYIVDKTTNTRFRVVVEASTAGLEPGEWPQYIEVELKGREPLPLHLKRACIRENFTTYYTADENYKFDILND